MLLLLSYLSDDTVWLTLTAVFNVALMSQFISAFCPCLLVASRMHVHLIGCTSVMSIVVTYSI